MRFLIWNLRCCVWIPNSTGIFDFQNILQTADISKTGLCQVSGIKLKPDYVSGMCDMYNIVTQKYLRLIHYSVPYNVLPHWHTEPIKT